MSYQRERDHFIAQMSREGLPLDIAASLLRAATTLNRYAELSCSSPAADRDRVPCPGARAGADESACLCDYSGTKHETVLRIDVLAARLQRRIDALMPAGWLASHQGDPRGFVLRVVPPSYAERNAGRPRHNLASIGVPSRDSGIKW